MILNRQNLDALRVGFKTSFQNGLGQAPSMHGRVATTITSTARAEKYGWLGKFPKMREWLGDRVIHNIMEHDYTVKNRDFEGTVSVDRNDIEDDTLGLYGTMFEELGYSAASLPDELVFALLMAGFTTPCYDGQFFFDTDHPVLDENGVAQSVSNTGGGAGTPWFLMVTKRPLKPLIFQQRKAPEFVNKDKPNDDNVFNQKMFVYGVDSRCNVGFGFWQFAYGSKQPLTPENYAAARAAIAGMKGDHGRPLGLVPDALIVPSTLEGLGKKIVVSSLTTGGETNEWAGTADLVMVPWLA